MTTTFRVDPRRQVTIVERKPDLTVHRGFADRSEFLALSIEQGQDLLSGQPTLKRKRACLGDRIGGPPGAELGDDAFANRESFAGELEIPDRKRTCHQELVLDPEKMPLGVGRLRTRLHQLESLFRFQVSDPDRVHGILVVRGMTTAYVKKVSSVRQEVREAVCGLGHAGIVDGGHGVAEHPAGRNAVDRGLRFRGEQDRSVAVPGPATTIQGAGHRHRRTAVEVEFLQLAIGKESDLSAVWRPERIGRAFGVRELSVRSRSQVSAGTARADPIQSMP